VLWAWVMLAALRGDGPTAAALLAQVRLMRDSDDPEDLSALASGAALTAAAQERPAEAFEHCLDALSYVGVLGLAHEVMRWCWPLATRIALDRADAEDVARLLALLPIELPVSSRPCCGPNGCSCWPRRSTRRSAPSTSRRCRPAATRQIGSYLAISGRDARW